jgi:tRNA A-37 threonylcarbamoyl transferase component Bud32
VRGWFRPSKARREFQHALALAERGLPTPDVLALGETEQGCSYLATRTVPAALSLGTFLEGTFRAWPAARQTRLRQRLAVVLGQLLGQLHNAGVSHQDLHPNNFLLRLNAEEEPELFLIDLHAVRLGGPLTWRAAQANLVLLNRWFILRAERSDRLRFWHAYQRSRGWRPQPTDKKLSAIRDPPSARRRGAAMARRLEKLTRASNLRFWDRQERNCVRSNRYFRRVGRGTVAGHAVADLPANILEELLADPDGPFRRLDRVVLKASPSSAVVEFDLPGPNGPQRVIYKRFALTRWTDPWTALLRPTPALRSYVLGHGLRLRCLPTPRPLGVWHRRRNGLLREGYLLTEKVHDARDLAAVVSALCAGPAARRREVLRRLIEQVAALVRELHSRGISHRDLKASNLLVAAGPAPGLLPYQEGLAAADRGARWLVRSGGSASFQEQVWLIDLVGVKPHRKLPRSRRVQNLARLHASFYQHPGLTRTDKLRFLRIYLRWGLRGRIGWKRWWRHIAAATQKKVQKNLCNGRPVG